jgi:serine/threonine protein kinase
MNEDEEVDALAARLRDSAKRSPLAQEFARMMAEGEAWKKVGVNLSSELPDWEPIRLLGGGGQGTTFLLEHCGDGKQSVLKVLRNQESKKARTRMFQEVAALVALREYGGSVPEVIEHNTANRDKNVPLFILMEHVEGTTLLDFVVQRKRVSIDRSLEITRSLHTTISKAHANSLMHRDIKPENLMLRHGQPDEVVVLDFGLAFNELDASGVTSVDERITNSFLRLPEGNVTGSDKRNKSPTSLESSAYFSIA